MQIVITDAPDDASRKAIGDLMDEYNDTQTEPSAARPLSVVARAPAGGEIIAGLQGWSYWQWFKIDFFPLPPGLGDLGARLLRSAEQEALRRGCHSIWVDSADAAMSELYLASGYGECARLSATHRFFRKRLVAGEAAFPAIEDSILRRPPGRVPPLGLLLRAPGSEVCAGGLLARPDHGWLFVELLILPAAERHSGIGTRLMALAEQEAAARGLIGVWLDTFSFQARPFYERLGYRMIGALEDYPPGHTRFLLAKRLDGAPLDDIKA
jgi:GNAT superfamily N-acetyltransferase